MKWTHRGAVIALCCIGVNSSGTDVPASSNRQQVIQASMAYQLEVDRLSSGPVFGRVEPRANAIVTPLREQESYLNKNLAREEAYWVVEALKRDFTTDYECHKIVLVTKSNRLLLELNEQELAEELELGMNRPYNANQTLIILGLLGQERRIGEVCSNWTKLTAEQKWVQDNPEQFISLMQLVRTAVRYSNLPVPQN